MFDLEQELLRLRDALHEALIEYALCGGLAMGVHGFPRATVDIDLLIRPEDYPRVERVAAELGFSFKSNPMTFSDGAMEIRRISKIDPADGEVLMLGLLLVTTASEDAWRMRETHAWHGRPLSVVSRNGLIALKRFRSSKLDLADIEHLESGA
ncbi:MAG TPA: hypothetical protein VHL59_14645 [Thermoanaerobaculia bacterium]|nr:hypothetical protein [Thermoanaerobaculia bacterium]